MRREESRHRVMLTEGIRAELEEKSALVSCGPHTGSGPVVTRGPNTGPGSNQQKKRSWCDHCKKLGHSKDVCWKLHGKPADWKPKQNRNCGYQSTVNQEEKNSQPG